MHELSIVMGIIQIAEKEAEKAGAKRIELIELEIGKLAGVELDALDFVWTGAVKNTILEGAKRKIHSVEGEGKCLECNSIFSLQHAYDPCPNCQNYLKGIVKGKELRVKELEVS